MDQKFAVLVEHLAPKMESLLRMPPLSYGKLPLRMPKSGVYLFSEGSITCMWAAQTISAGATADIAVQVQHTVRLHSHFCWHEKKLVALSRHIAPAKIAAMDSCLTLSSLRHLWERRNGSEKMEYRYVEEVDQNRQELLEIYSAVVLQTRYNDFGTH